MNAHWVNGPMFAGLWVTRPVFAGQAEPGKVCYSNIHTWCLPIFLFSSSSSPSFSASSPDLFRFFRSTFPPVGGGGAGHRAICGQMPRKEQRTESARSRTWRRI
eukprot:g16377.t1